GNPGFVVKRESSAFPAIINGDLVSVNGFDNPMKYFSRFLLGSNSDSSKVQADGDDDEFLVGLHMIVPR
ncbi:MAG: hypothetical protein MPJ22_07810, partial [Pirellulales bacterium]|nr:hypothetical protein [Pirellulales bacterium]